MLFPFQDYLSQTRGPQKRTGFPYRFLQDTLKQVPWKKTIVCSLGGAQATCLVPGVNYLCLFLRNKVMLRMEDGFVNNSWKEFMNCLNSLSKFFGHRGRLDRFRDLYIDKSSHPAFVQDMVC